MRRWVWLAGGSGLVAVVAFAAYGVFNRLDHVEDGPIRAREATRIEPHALERVEPSEPALLRGDDHGSHCEVRFSSDGRLVWIGGGERERLFDLKTSALVVERRAKKGDDDAGDAPALLPDRAAPDPLRPPPAVGKRTLELDGGRTLQLPGNVVVAAWSPRGGQLVIVLDEEVFLWNTERGELVQLAGSPTAHAFAACSSDGTRVLMDSMRVLDVRTGKVTPLKSESEAHLALAWRKGDSEVVVSVGDSVERFDAATGERRGAPTRPNHRDWEVRQVSGDYAVAVRIPYGQTYEVFNVETGEKLIELGDIVQQDEMYALFARVAVGEGGRFLAKRLHTIDVRDFETDASWWTGVSTTNAELKIEGSRLVSVERERYGAWDIATGKPLVQLALPEHDRAFRDSISHGGDRFLLDSGRVVAVESGKTLLQGPRGLGTLAGRYREGCWGPEDRFVVLIDSDVVVLHHPERGDSVMLYQFVTANGVETLAMAPDGGFECSDAVAESVWFRVDGKLVRANSLASLRRRGLLAAFHDR